MNTVINLLKIACDENRLRILNIIKDEPLCVGEIQTILNITQSNASKHLEKIKSSGIVNYYKKAQFIFYSLSDDTLTSYPFLKQLLYEDIKNIDVFKQDLVRLKKYKSTDLCCQDLKKADFNYSNLDL